MRPLLVVVTGPIGSGKSTIAAALSTKIGESLGPVALVDLDDVVAQLQSADDAERTWRAARRVHSALVGAWLAAGAAVVAHGPFYVAEDWDVLLSAVPPAAVVRRVLLRTSFGVALARVEGHPTRRLSKNPEFLRMAHDRFNELLPSMEPSDSVFDTEVMQAEDVVAALAAEVLEAAG